MFQVPTAAADAPTERSSERAEARSVSLDEIRAATERRLARQATALARFDKPAVSVTVVMPGPVKDGWVPRRVLEATLEELERVASAARWRILWRHVVWLDTGPEALYVVDVDAELLKCASVQLEDEHPLGRLCDLHGVAPGQGVVSREALGLLPRR